MFETHRNRVLNRLGERFSGVLIGFKSLSRLQTTAGASKIVKKKRVSSIMLHWFIK